MGKIIIGILFIIGGLSGEFVLMGTNSPEALMGLGAILILVGLFQVANKKEEPIETDAEQEDSENKAVESHKN